MIDAIPLLLAPEGYQISRSVRLRSSATAYFNRTPASASNRQKFTWSGWVKRGRLTDSNSPRLFGAWSANTDNGWFTLDFMGDDNLEVQIWTAAVKTSAVFRDPSAWYHIVLAVDTTQATAANRVLVYVNGVSQTLVTSAGTGIAGFTQNLNTSVNNNVVHSLGAFSAASLTSYFDGYLTEINFIDGQALTPSSFGQTNYITGVWSPIKYTGTYGTNGFYLNFSDNSNNTAATIGKDYSGNGNNWTPNNISVTSGTTYDSMLDVPTQWPDGGNGRGNYAVMNPVSNLSTGSTLSAANLNVVTASSGETAIPGTIFVTSGKWYCEATINSVAAGTNGVGIIPTTQATGTGPGSSVASYGYTSGGNKRNNSTNTAYGATYTTNDVIGIALDMDAGTLTFYKNGTTQGQAFSGITGEYTFAFGEYGSASSAGYSVNFGQRPFAYTPPTGFLALNTLNLSTPTILKGNQYMDATTYTGTNGVAGSVVNAGGFQPDFVWGKSRNNADSHTLIDAVRGITKGLFSDLTLAEQTNANYITSFNSNGFSYGVSSAFSNGNLVAWQWKEGATQGFDIVTYTGDGTSNLAVNHSLGVAPRMIILKRRNAADSWPVYHASATSLGQFLVLNSTAAVATTANSWGTSNPNSSSFFVGATSGSATNVSGGTYVAYLFAEVAGFSRFGSYTGNGSTDGPFVFCGFRPRWLMIKSTGIEAWLVLDSSRQTYNVIGPYLLANASDAEGTASVIDFTSNGFKIRNTGGSYNTSSTTYIYAAFAENPFKNALAR